MIRLKRAAKKRVFSDTKQVLPPLDLIFFEKFTDRVQCQQPVAAIYLQV